MLNILHSTWYKNRIHTALGLFSWKECISRLKKKFLRFCWIFLTFIHLCTQYKYREKWFSQQYSSHFLHCMPPKILCVKRICVLRYQKCWSRWNWYLLCLSERLLDTVNVLYCIVHVKEYKKRYRPMVCLLRYPYNVWKPPNECFLLEILIIYNHFF